MALRLSDIKAFSDAFGNEAKKDPPRQLYGTVVDGGVLLDGGESPTPCTNLMDTHEGDRVACRIQNGECYVVGNATAPATDDTAADAAQGDATQALENASIADGKAESALDAVKESAKTVETLYYASASTTAPSKPTSHVTRSTDYHNGWTRVVPSWNASYPYYYECQQLEYNTSPATYSWTDVWRDYSITNANQTAASAQSLASSVSSALGVLDQHFYHNANGAFVEDEDGNIVRVYSGGMELKDALARLLAEFLTTGMNLYDPENGNEIFQAYRDHIKLKSSDNNHVASFFRQSSGANIQKTSGSGSSQKLAWLSVDDGSSSSYKTGIYAGDANGTWFSLHKAGVSSSAPLPVGSGGTGATSASSARTSLGLGSGATYNVPFIKFVDVTLTNQTGVAANSAKTWTQTLPTVSGFTPWFCCGVLLYNNTNFVPNRWYVSGGDTLNMSVRNLSSSSASMSGTSHAYVMYIRNGMCESA